MGTYWLLYTYHECTYGPVLATTHPYGLGDALYGMVAVLRYCMVLHTTQCTVLYYTVLVLVLQYALYLHPTQ